MYCYQLPDTETSAPETSAPETSEGINVLAVVLPVLIVVVAGISLGVIVPLVVVIKIKRNRFNKRKLHSQDAYPLREM